MVLALVGLSVRDDLAGVTSVVRALGLRIPEHRDQRLNVITYSGIVISGSGVLIAHSGHRDQRFRTA
jgi:hypothetical protein